MPWTTESSILLKDLAGKIDAVIAEYEQKVKTLTDELQRHRPVADAYRRVCESFKIEGNIRGYVMVIEARERRLRAALDKCVGALAVVMLNVTGYDWNVDRLSLTLRTGDAFRAADAAVADTDTFQGKKIEWDTPNKFPHKGAGIMSGSIAMAEGMHARCRVCRTELPPVTFLGERRHTCNDCRKLYKTDGFLDVKKVEVCSICADETAIYQLCSFDHKSSTHHIGKNCAQKLFK